MDDDYNINLGHMTHADMAAAVSALTALTARAERAEAEVARLREVLHMLLMADAQGGPTRDEWNRAYAALAAEPPEDAYRCPSRDNGGARCELPIGHSGEHACPEQLARFKRKP